MNARNSMEWEIRLEAKIKDLAATHGARPSTERIARYVKRLARYGECKAVIWVLDNAHDDDRMPNPRALQVAVDAELRRTAPPPTEETLHQTPKERRAANLSAIITMVWLHLARGKPLSYFEHGAGALYVAVWRTAERELGRAGSESVAEVLRREILRGNWTKETVDAWMQERFDQCDRHDRQRGSLAC